MSVPLEAGSSAATTGSTAAVPAAATSTSAPAAGPASAAFVRDARREDADTLIDFQKRLAFETEGIQLKPELIEKGVHAVFDSSEMGFYLVAEEADGQGGGKGTVVGCLMVTYEWSDWRNGNFYWIQSVYVDQQKRRLGIFRALYETVVRKAQTTANVCGVRLYAEKHNQSAQGTYLRLGMHHAPYDMFEIDFHHDSSRPGIGASSKE